MQPPSVRLARAAAPVVAVAISLAASTALVAVLESLVGVPGASEAYLLAVVAIAVAFGTRAAIGTAIGSVVAYNVLFVEPRFTLTVAEPGQWLTLVLLLAMGIVVGQLAGLQRARADAAEAREREARALFAVSRALATGETLPAAAGTVVAVLREGAGMERVWIRLDDEAGAAGGVLADTDPTVPVHEPPGHVSLGRRPGDTPAVWTRIVQPTRARRPDEALQGRVAYRVRIASTVGTLGSVWALRPRQRGDPDRSQTRLMAAAADQLAGSIARDRLAARAREAEIARRSEAVKTALLDSVSHDLRTPLASIRAAAGSLMDPQVTWDPETGRQTAAAIDREAERLNRLVSNLLDMSRIEAGGLRPSLRPHVLADLVDLTVARLRPLVGPRSIEVRVPDDLPPVMVDDVFVDQVLTNLLENVGRYTPATSRVAISAAGRGEHVLLTVADDGPGVPTDALPHLFSKFYRVPRSGEGARRGTGIGLAVVRGVVEAMGGTIVARHAPMGGLAVDLTLPVAPERRGPEALGQDAA